jgi:tetratricopeptide (TPR) repeat protein
MPERSRARRLAWTAVLVLSVASAVALSATAIILPRTTAAVATPMSVRQLLDDGDQQLAVGDFAGALKSYDRAMALDRRDVAAYYRAGVALSFLDDREQQTAALFRWVVRYGEPGREEVRLARAWLEAAQISIDAAPR